MVETSLLQQVNETNITTIASAKGQGQLGLTLVLVFGPLFVVLTNWDEDAMVSDTGYFNVLATEWGFSSPDDTIVICCKQNIATVGTARSRSITIDGTAVVYGLCRAKNGGATWDRGPSGPYSQGSKLQPDEYRASVFEEIADSIGNLAMTNLLKKVAFILPTAWWKDDHASKGQPFDGHEHLGALFGPAEFVCPTEWEQKLDTIESQTDYNEFCRTHCKSIATNDAKVTLSVDITLVPSLKAGEHKLSHIVTEVLKQFKQSETAYNGKAKRGLKTLSAAVEAAGGSDLLD